VRSASQRIAAYNARMLSSLIDPTLTAMQDQQQANFAAYVDDFYPFQAALRNWMDGQGINGAAAFVFEAFNNEVYSAYRRFSGASLIAQVTVLVDKYEDLGAARADLIALVLDVWALVVV
jgi:hypothetical protein